MNRFCGDSGRTGKRVPRANCAVSFLPLLSCIFTVTVPMKIN